MRAILFPGQGAQFVGMGKDFFDQSQAAREVFEKANEALGISLSELCFDGPKEKLSETDICQPAILTTSAAIVAALEERGVCRREEFDVAAGLSLGEYTALWFAGALDLEDAIRLVRVRGQGMQAASDAAPSGMASMIGAKPEAVQALCEKYGQGEVLRPANYLAPGNIAISGAKEALDRAVAGAKGEGIRRAIPLDVAGAFHSPLMEPGVPRLQEALEQIDRKPLRIPVYSNVTAKPHEEAGVRDHLVEQVTSPVRWEDSMQALLQAGVTEFWEPGPGTVLTGLMAKIQRDSVRQSVARYEDLEGLATEEGTG